MNIYTGIYQSNPHGISKSAIDIMNKIDTVFRPLEAVLTEAVLLTEGRILPQG